MKRVKKNKWCHWQFEGRRTGLYPLWHWIWRIGPFWGYVWWFWGSDGGLKGPKWLIYTPMVWMKWVEKKMVSLAILGWDNGPLPTMRVDKVNWAILGVCMAVRGVWCGPPGSQMVNSHPHGVDEVGWEKKIGHGQDRSLPSFDSKPLLLQFIRYTVYFWGLYRGP